MPQLAVAAAGAWIGSMAGTGVVALGMTGAQIGWMAGSLLGSLLFSPKGPKAQLGDTRAPKIDHGSKMTRVYGTVRVPLNPRWLPDFTADEQSAGGKGGGGGSSYYTYSTSPLYWAADGINVEGVSRIWMNGELVWTALAASDAESLANSANSDHWDEMQFFDGNGAQLPWSVYEAAVGSVNADAHRRIACIAFTNLKCGNSPQLPFMEAEIYTGSTEADVCLVLERGAAFEWTPGADQPTGTDWNPFIPQVDRNWDVSGAGATLTGFVNSWQPGGFGDPTYTQTFTISSPPVSGGCRYAEILFVVEASSSSNDIGILGVKTSGGDWWGMNYPGFAVSSADPIGTSIAGSWSSDGTVIMLAYKDGNLWIGLDGSWLEASGDPANPATGTNPTHTGIEESISLFVDYFADIPSVQLVLRTRLSEFDYAPPSGFDEWSATFQSATVVTPQPADLADIVSAECLRSGLTADEIDVTDLVGTDVAGFKCEATAADAIGQLMGAFYFYCLPGRKLAFRFLDAASIATIQAADTGAGVDQASEVFAGLMRGNDLELPAQVSLTAPNPSADYDPATATSDRIVTVANRIEQAQLAVVFTPAELKGRANANVLDARVAAHTATISVDDTFAAYEPGDVITHVDEEGNSYITRWVKESYQQGVKTVDLRLFDRSVLTLTGTMSDTYTPALIVTAPAAPDLYLFDSPILRDEDNAHGIYATVTADGEWEGAELWLSRDSSFTSPVSVGLFANRGVVGTATELGDFTGWTWDTANSMTVTLDAETDGLTASTKAAIEADLNINVALVGAHERWEAVRFANASLLAPDTYLSSDFLRGQLGTEHANADHEAGDTFALMRTTGIIRVPLASSDVGNTLYLKAVPPGRALSAVTAVEIEYTAEGLKPLAPLDLVVDVDGILSWNRRSRLAYAGLPGTNPPLGETTELYEVDVFNGGTLLATLTATVPNVDLSPYPTATKAVVYQMSEAIGRGRPAEINL
jgi:hypothetical protein